MSQFYSQTIALPTNGLPKALRYVDIEGREDQSILLELTEHNLGIIVPENTILFAGKSRPEYITYLGKKQKTFVIPKNNIVLLREVCVLFNDDTWKKECIYPPVDKDSELPRFLDRAIVQGSLGPFEVEIVEYSEKFVVLFTSSYNDLASMLSSKIKSNNFTHYDGFKKKSFGLAKSSKDVSEFKKFFTTDFETLYKFPVSGPSYSVPASLPGTFPEIGSPTFYSNQVASINPASLSGFSIPSSKSSLGMDMFSLMTKLKVLNEVETKPILDGKVIIYGPKDKVDMVYSTYSGSTVLGRMTVNDREMICLELESL